MTTAGEITAIYRGTMRSRPNDDGTVWIVGSADEDGLGIKVTGTIDEGDLAAGLTYRFWGQFETNKWGEQFKFDSVVEEEPASGVGIIAYLQQCPGVGPVTARKMYDEWGDAAVKMLREDPDAVLAKIPRLTAENAAAASSLLKEKAGKERIKIDLMGLLHRCGVPKKVADKAIKEWGVEAVERIKQNPYLLMKFRGIGFLKTDKLWLQFGLPPAKLKRQALCCWYSIARDTNGHTWFPLTDARNALRQSLSGATVRFDDAMRLATKAGMLSVRKAGPQTWVAERAREVSEGRIARLIDEARIESDDGGLLWPDPDESGGFNVSDHQRGELAKAIRGVVAILAGSPGTGKTYCAAQVIKVLLSIFGRDHVAAAAPTGKAAVRLTESLAKCGVSLKARTIHSLLAVHSNGDGGMTFRHNERNPLPFKVVLIDESSMIDTPLFASLLAARGIGTHYLFLGDPHQLAPVGHGAPLRDLLGCPESVPSGMLTEIQRNSGRIVQACAQIRDRKPWATSKQIDLENGENLLLLERETPDEQIETLESVLARMMDAQPRKFDPIWDVQVIVAVNKKGPLCKKAVNERLQALLNPNGERADRSPFRVGDKIVNTKNGYLSPPKKERTGHEVDENPFGDAAPPAGDDSSDGDDVATDEQGRIYVANGEQAEVIAVDTHQTIARLTNPDRVVCINRKAKAADDEGTGENGPAPAEGEAAENTEGKTDTGCSWELGYAISAHKSQGSEWPITIIMLDDSNPARMTCSRQWLFTAMSRGKVFDMLIGTKETANAMCQRDALFKRKTFLRERTEELRLLSQREPDADQAPRLEFVADSESADELDAILEGVF